MFLFESIIVPKVTQHSPVAVFYVFDRFIEFLNLQLLFLISDCVNPFLFFSLSPLKLLNFENLSHL
jgi:hypothetical protein